MSNTFRIKTSSTVAELMDNGIIDSISQLYTAKDSGKKGKANNNSGTYELLVPLPANVDEMNAFMRNTIAEAPAGTLFKTNLILEAIFGKGKVPSPGTAGRDVMDKLWHLVSPNWKDLVKDGFVMKGPKRGQYVGDAIEIENYLEMVDEVQAHIPESLIVEDEDEVEVEVEAGELELDGLSFDDLD